MIEKSAHFHQCCAELILLKVFRILSLILKHLNHNVVQWDKFVTEFGRGALFHSSNPSFHVVRSFVAEHHLQSLLCTRFCNILRVMQVCGQDSTLP